MPTTTVVSRAKAYLKARQKSVRDAMKVSKMPQKRDAPDAESVMAARSSGICAVARSK